MWAVSSIVSTALTRGVVERNQHGPPLKFCWQMFHLIYKLYNANYLYKIFNQIEIVYNLILHL